MLDMWINFADGVLLVFAVNDRESFDALERKRERIIKTKGDKTCFIVLVGNKCDLENEREITIEAGKSLASSWGAGYIETSATV